MLDSRPVVIVILAIAGLGTVTEAMGLVLQVIDHDVWDVTTFIEALAFLMFATLSIKKIRRLKHGFYTAPSRWR